MSQRCVRTGLLAAAFSALVLATPAAAASQGRLGAVSSGSISISVSLRAPPRLTGLADVAFEGEGATFASVPGLCLRGPSHAYAVAVSGSGPDGALSLSDGRQRIGYRVEWLTRSGERGVELPSDSAPLTLRAAANPADCARVAGSGDLRIALDPADADRLRAGAPFTGTLMLTLAPE